MNTRGRPSPASSRNFDDLSVVANGSRNGKASKKLTFSNLRGERTVKKLRLSKALTIPERTTVYEACRRMAARRVDAVLLTDANCVLSGIVTAKDIATRVIAEGLRVEQTIMFEIMTRNPMFVMFDTLAIEALQKMVEGKFRHLPVVENGEVIALLDLPKCLSVAISRLEKAAEKGRAIAAAVEGVEHQLEGNFSAPSALTETLGEKMFKPSLSTIITENTKVAIVSPTDPVCVATQKMREFQVNSVVVASGNTLQGIFTSKDVLMRVVAQNISPELTLVEKVMTANPDCVTLDTTILDALHRMHDGKFFHIPVIDRDGQIAACLDDLQLTRATIELVEGGNHTVNDFSNSLMQKFWDSALALEPPDDDSDSDSEVSSLMAEAGDVGHTEPLEMQTLNFLSTMNPSHDDLRTELNNLQRIVHGTKEPSNLNLSLLRHITNNFSDALKIGHGGCGVVYKGVLPFGIIVAVKKLFDNHTIDDNMFHREVTNTMTITHKNIVRFLGYCSHTEEKAVKIRGKIVLAQIRERLLCFEYISNGSLENHLKDELRGLEWHKRYQIIEGFCDGLYHLHNEKHIIHMDLKPANILLDDQMVPKITDFGLSRLDDKSKTMSTERLISLGYCSPEYLHHGKMSAKSDIYSLGVIILELVTGSKEGPNITTVLRRWKHRWNKSAKDTPLALGYKQVSKCLNLVQRCRHTDPANRPNIQDIIDYLNKMDTTDEDINDASEGLELEDMLGIEPLDIHLPIKRKKSISCSIELTNDTGNYFAFRISTTSLHPYHIDPTKDIVPPRSKRSVTITLQALEKSPLHNQCKDEFSVQSTKVEGTFTAMDISGQLFDEVSGKVVDKVNLMIVLGTQYG